MEKPCLTCIVKVCCSKRCDSWVKWKEWDYYKWWIWDKSWDAAVITGCIIFVKLLEFLHNG